MLGQSCVRVRVRRLEGADFTILATQKFKN